MPDSVTVTTQESWFGRLGGSLKSVVGGLVLLVGSFPLLFWNESRAVRTARSLAEGAVAVVSVASDSAVPANEGRLVHTNGSLDSGPPLVDRELGVEIVAVKLSREVEMYQWLEDVKSESRKKLGGGSETVKTYSYSRGWSPRLIDASAFQEPSGHQNPTNLPFAPLTVVAEVVRLGAFRLSAEQVALLDDTERLTLPADAEAPGEHPHGPLRVVDGVFYLGANPQDPAVGDARIAYRVVRPKEASVVGVQRGDSFTAYRAAAGDHVLLVEEGIRPAAEMFQAAHDRNRAMTWILRFVGWLLMFFGLALVFRPIAVFGDLVPLVGSLLGAGIGAFAFLLASVLALLTIALAWLVVRPLLGITLLALAGGALTLLVRRARRRRAAAAGSQTPLPPLPPPPLPPLPRI